MKSIFVVLFLFSSSVFAQTVSDQRYLMDMMEKKSHPLSYDEMEGFFKESPQFDMNCVDDPDVKNTDQKSIAVFAPYIKYEDFKGYLKFNFEELKYGFNVKTERLDKTGISNPKQDLYRFTTDLLCGNSLTDEQKEDKNCGVFTMSQEEFPVKLSGEDFKPEATKSESWSIYFIDKNTLIAEVLLDFLGTELNWLGSKKGSVTYTKKYLCYLQRVESQTESQTR